MSIEDRVIIERAARGWRSPRGGDHEGRDPFGAPNGECRQIASSALITALEGATQPKIPPWALIIFSAMAWNSGK